MGKRILFGKSDYRGYPNLAEILVGYNMFGCKKSRKISVQYMTEA